MVNSGQPTVLISSAGRRVELLRAFRRTAAALANGGGNGRVLAADCSWYSSAFHDADDAFIVPRCHDADFVPQMVDICARNHVDLVVPTIDPELPVYAAAQEQFAAVGTTVAISSPDVVAIAADKAHTHDWLSSEGFPTVRQGTVADLRSDPDAWPLPLMVKPRFGSASLGVTLVNSPQKLEHTLSDWNSAKRGEPERELVVQSVARGVEYTVDVLVPRRDMSSREAARMAVVPRRRIEVRAGEVSKGVTVRSPVLIELAEKLCATLPNAYGPLNIQMFLDEQTGQVAVIEINARFGGGYPLSYAAGADFPGALLQEACGRPIMAELHNWRENLVMLRYDAAVFVDGSGSEAQVSQ